MFLIFLSEPNLLQFLFSLKGDEEEQVHLKDHVQAFVSISFTVTPRIVSLKSLSLSLDENYRLRCIFYWRQD